MSPTPDHSQAAISTIGLIGAIAGFFVGAIAAVVFLFLKPTPTVEKLPEQQPPGMVYYIPGSKTQTSYWKQMRHAFYTPRRIKMTLREDDLNKWATATLNVYTPPINPKQEPSVAFGPHGAPNFRIDNSQLHVTLHFDFKLYGAKIPIIFQASGNFTETGWGFDFTPLTMHLGSLPIPESFRSVVLDHLILPAFNEKTELKKLKEAWSKLAWIKLQNDTLQVARTE